MSNVNFSNFVDRAICEIVVISAPILAATIAFSTFVMAGVAAQNSDADANRIMLIGGLSAAGIVLTWLCAMRLRTLDVSSRSRILRLPVYGLVFVLTLGVVGWSVGLF
jgi:hypothetical protein